MTGEAQPSFLAQVARRARQSRMIALPIIAGEAISIYNVTDLRPGEDWVEDFAKYGSKERFTSKQQEATQ